MSALGQQQSIGGIGTRCAYLDIYADKVSHASLEALAEPSALAAAVTKGSSAKVVRSREVDVIFKASNAIVVKVDDVRHEITPAVVGLITWCN